MQTKRAGIVKYSENLETAEAKDESGIKLLDVWLALKNIYY